MSEQKPKVYNNLREMLEDKEAREAITKKMIEDVKKNPEVYARIFNGDWRRE